MRSKLIGIFLLLTVKSIESLQIKPNCQNGNFIANTVSGTSISLYYCKIEDAILLEESEVITFNTSANKKADELVEVFWFSSTEFRYLPNIVFERFVNLFYVWMDGKKLQDIQMHYFIGARKLSRLNLQNNQVTALTSKIFLHAPHLEYINLKNNKIGFVDETAFYGLSKLKGLYMPNNFISKLSKNTFMSLKKMSDFDVRSNVCINAQYTSKNISSYQVDVFAGCEKPYLVTDALEAKMSLIIDVLQDLAKMLKKTGNGD